MKIPKQTTFLLLFLPILSVVAVMYSCSSIKKFNESTHATLEANGASTTQVQFYNDRRIALRRIVSDFDLKTVNGEIRTINGVKYQYIIIDPMTQGLCIEDKQTLIKISFEEEGKDDLFFYFRGDGMKTRYRIADESYKWIEKAGDKISYGGQKFEVIDGFDALLLYKDLGKYKKSVSTRRAKGRSLK